MTTEGLQTLKLEQLHESPWNPRKFFDQAKLAELANSIKANGIIEPLLARPNAKGFELAAGHRRYRAAKLAGVDEAPVIIRAMPDKQFLVIPYKYVAYCATCVYRSFLTSRRDLARQYAREHEHQNPRHKVHCYRADWRRV
jgi:ParB-like nuclease family protein